MINNIHKWLIIRLAMVCLVLSLVIGGLVQYIGHTRLDDHVIQMAQTETTPYATEFISYLQFTTEEALAHFNLKIHDLIKNDNLIVVEFH